MDRLADTFRADAALSQLFTLPSSLDTITIDASTGLQHRRQFSWLHSLTGKEIDWPSAKLGDQKRERPRVDFFNRLLGG
jgi:hypothetical protein